MMEEFDRRDAHQRALNREWMGHPESFVRGRPTASKVPVEVWINRPEMESTNNAPQAAV